MGARIPFSRTAIIYQRSAVSLYTHQSMASGLSAGTGTTGVRGEPFAVRTRRHVTRRLIPYLMFIYLLAYLDRANVGIAKLQMQKDLNFSDAVIGFGAGIFFLGYLLLDIP